MSDEPRRLIVCGGRDDPLDIMGRAILRGLVHNTPNLAFAAGGARGVDQAADTYLRGLGVFPLVTRAQWEDFGRRAGHIRNQAMLDAGALGTLAIKARFNWSLSQGGTEDMVRRTVEAGLPAWVLQRVTLP